MDLLHREQMAHVIAGGKQLPAKVRLKEAIEELAVPDLVLVAIEQIRLRVAIDGIDVLEEYARLEDVVMIEEAEEVALRDGDAFVGIARNAVVLVECHHPYAIIVCRARGHSRGKLLVLGRRVDKDKLELAIGLLENGL